MLSAHNRPVVEATLPVVGQHVGEIARRFYRHMFGEHPELLDGVFNRGNQAEGSQPVALAGSVAVFASTLLRTPEQVPEQLLSRIAHKHASLGIRPEQYQVVHDNLFWAIVDVLGDAVTPEVAAAWDEVYWLMAHALRLAWGRAGTRRVWVHTCTLDHPGALAFYARHGFRPFARAVETFADPRLAGLLPRDCAPPHPTPVAPMCAMPAPMA